MFSKVVMSKDELLILRYLGSEWRILPEIKKQSICLIGKNSGRQIFTTGPTFVKWLKHKPHNSFCISQIEKNKSWRCVIYSSCLTVLACHNKPGDNKSCSRAMIGPWAIIWTCLPESKNPLPGSHVAPLKFLQNSGNKSLAQKHLVGFRTAVLLQSRKTGGYEKLLLPTYEIRHPEVQWKHGSDEPKYWSWCEWSTTYKISQKKTSSWLGSANTGWTDCYQFAFRGQTSAQSRCRF